MRIRPNQLEAELKKNLLPIYLISGDEPLLVQEALDTLREKCKKSGFDERKITEVDKKFDWKSLNDDANMLSLFAEKTVTELRLSKFKPGIPGGKALQEYCNNLPEDKILIISANKFDAATFKSKWCSTIDKTGAIIQIWPINLNEMPGWISQRARKMGLHVEQDAISLLSDRLEGNLLAAQQELEKLKLLYAQDPITAEKVLESVSDASKYDIFNLTDACLSGNSKLCVKILNNLKLEGLEVAFALWAITKEIRTVLTLAHAIQKGLPIQSIFKQQRIIQKRQAGLTQTAQKHHPKSLSKMLDQCKKADDLIKGIEKGLSPWDVLTDVALSLSGKKVF